MTNLAAFKAHHIQKIDCARSITLGMAELQPDGISEQWFLKLGGDIHWSLIAQAMGQKQAVFEDVYGREVYAAFCATSIELSPQTKLLAKNVEITSSLYHVSHHQIGSVHKILLAKQEIASLLMISTFVSHGEDKANTLIVRNKYMPSLSLDMAPQELLALAEHARTTARVNTNPEMKSDQNHDVTPCRSLDFNAVGLLYFPSFSKFAENFECQIQKTTQPLKRRDVVYLGNLDIGASINLASSGSDVFIHRDDGKLIAKISSKRCAMPES